MEPINKIKEEESVRNNKTTAGMGRGSFANPSLKFLGRFCVGLTRESFPRNSKLGMGSFPANVSSFNPCFLFCDILVDGLVTFFKLRDF